MSELKQRFIEVFNATGWSQAETARRMDMTRGGVNGIVTGDTIPTPGTVRFLEMLAVEAGTKFARNEMEAAARSHVAEINRRDSGSSDLATKLNELHDKDPKAFKAAKMMIETMHAKVNYKTKPKPKPRSSSKKIKADADAIQSDAILSFLERRHPDNAKS